jgi:predicted ATPase/transcriptional regulator with XRE-family HTH domain
VTNLSFGRWLQRRRKALDLTQAELSQRVGCAAVTVHKFETDALRPSRQMAHRLADELSVAPSERDAFVRFARSESSAQQPSFLPSVSNRAAGPVSPRHRHNLPHATTRFFGREAEVSSGRTLLRGTARLLTLTGAGGIGKTRLGLEIAMALVDSFADGVWFVDLAPLLDPGLLLATVAGVVGVRNDPSQPLETAFLREIGDQELLLVLDNCEHLVDACSRLVEVILAHAPKVRVLTTSRVALRAHGEIHRPIGPLALPPHGSTLLLQLEEYASVELLFERVRAVEPRFVVTDENAPALVQICHRLDGIPLALELAAARANVLNVQLIASRLDDRFRLLTTGSRTALPRHQTLRATLDWSYQLLSPRDQRVFARLAVFAGGWDLEAAEMIAAGDEIEPAEVLDGLAALIDHSLVTVEDHAGQRRYRLLETIRQYAWELLLQTGNSAAVQRRHLEWYLGLAERFDAELPGTNQQPGAIQLAAEYDNLRIALAWSLENDPERALGLAAHLAEFWRRSGHHDEGRRWLDAVLDTVITSSCPSFEAQARVLLGAGQLAADAGEFGPHEIARAETSVQLFRAVGNQRALVDALQHLGRCVLESGGPVERVQLAFDESLQVAQDSRDQHGIGFALANLAYLLWYRGERQQALQQCLLAIAHVRASGDALFTGLLLGLIGWWTLADNDTDGARRYKEEGLVMLRDLGAKEAIGLALLGMAHVARRAGADAWLRSLLMESALLLRETSSPGLNDWLSFVGQFQVERGEYVRGVRLLAAGDSDGARFGSLRLLLYQTPRSAVDESLAAARAALGEVAFRVAWTEGNALSAVQAMATALDGLEPVGAT